MKPLLTAIVLLLSFAAYSWPCDSCLILQGKINSRDRATINIFEKSDSCEWTLWVSAERRKKYSVHLDPEKTYRIEFINEKSGSQKTLYVIGGQQGYFHEIVDVNFMPSEYDDAYIDQANEYEYNSPRDGRGP